MIDANTTELVRKERVEADAEEHYRLYVRPLLQRAREEIRDELMQGKRIGNVDLASILDEELNSERYHDFIFRISESVSTGDNYWLYRYVLNCVEEDLKGSDMVEQRAYRLAEAE